MSRRFGRNQRRRLREQLAAEQLHAVRVQKDLESRLGSRAAEAMLARKFAYEVANLVGAHALAAGEPVMSMVTLSLGETQFRLPVHTPQFPIYTPLGGSVPDGLVHHEVMNLLQVKAVQLGAARDMHCLVRIGNGHAGYAISDSALHRADRDYLERTVGREIVRELLNQIRGGRP